MIEDDDIDLSVEESVKVLETAELRLQINTSWGEDRPWYDAQILYNGQWLMLGRTDLLDDVRTGVCLSVDDDVEKLRKLYLRSLKRMNVGTRISNTSFSVVDSMTDG